MATSRFVRYQHEEWSALYIDGKLDVVGDSYLSDERIAELLGVEEHGDDDAFLRGGNSRSDVAPTLTALAEWQGARDAKLAEAAELLRRADALVAEAKALRNEAVVRH